MNRDREAYRQDLFQLLEEAEQTEQPVRKTKGLPATGKAISESVTEQTLITRSRSSHAGTAEMAFKELIQRHQAYVYTYLLYNVDDQKIAEELAHGTFVAAYQHISDFRGDVPFQIWLLKLTEEQLHEHASPGESTSPPPSIESDQNSQDAPPTISNECQNIRCLLQDYAEDMLQQTAISQVEAHLDTCTPCWIAYEELKEAQSLPLSVLQEIPVPDTLTARIVNTLFPQPSIWDQLRTYFHHAALHLSGNRSTFVPVAANVVFVLLLSFLSVSYYNTLLRNEALLKKNTRQEQRLVEISEKRSVGETENSAAVNTVIMFARSFDSHSKEQDGLDDVFAHLSAILPDRKKKDVMTIHTTDKNLVELEDELIRNIQAAHGIFKTETLPDTDSLLIRKITAGIPKDSNEFVSLLVEQLTDQPSEKTESHDILRKTVEFYLIDNR